MFRRAYSAGFTQRPDPTVMGAFSGLEIACWDILGKARGRPVWALLGGMMNERVRSYTYLYPLPGQDACRVLGRRPTWPPRPPPSMVRHGFTAVKFDPAGPYTIRGGHQPAMSDITRSVAFCRAIREAVGDRADLLFGTHGQFTTGGAIRLGAGAGALFAAVVRRAGAARQHRRDGRGGARGADSRRHRRAADHQDRVRPGPARRRGKILQPALGRAGRHLGGQEDRRHGRGLQRRRSRRISMPGRSNGRRTSTSPPRSRTC